MNKKMKIKEKIKILEFASQAHILGARKSFRGLQIVEVLDASLMFPQIVEVGGNISRKNNLYSVNLVVDLEKRNGACRQKIWENVVVFNKILEEKRKGNKTNLFNVYLGAGNE